jgi:hypothetical protein
VRSELPALSRDLQRLLDDLEPLQHAVGQFAKTEALDQAARDLGADRAFSGWRRKVALGAGYDLGTPVVINLRPAGLWSLAETGRRRTKKIKPRNGRAVRTPKGLRKSSTSRPSRALRTISTVEQNIGNGIERAAADGMNDVIRKAGF